MKSKIIALLLLTAVGAHAQTTPVLFSLQNLTGTVNNRLLHVEPDRYQNLFLFVTGTNVTVPVALDLQPTNGSVTANLVPWGYTLYVDGFNRGVHFTVPASTNCLNVASLISTNLYSPLYVYQDTVIGTNGLFVTQSNNLITLDGSLFPLANQTAYFPAILATNNNPAWEINADGSFYFANDNIYSSGQSLNAGIFSLNNGNWSVDHYGNEIGHTFTNSSGTYSLDSSGNVVTSGSMSAAALNLNGKAVNSVATDANLSSDGFGNFVAGESVSSEVFWDNVGSGMFVSTNIGLVQVFNGMNAYPSFYNSDVNLGTNYLDLIVGHTGQGLTKVHLSTNGTLSGNWTFTVTNSPGISTNLQFTFGSTRTNTLYFTNGILMRVSQP